MMPKIRFHKLAAIVVLIGFAAWMGTGAFSSVGSAAVEGAAKAGDQAKPGDQAKAPDAAKPKAAEAESKAPLSDQRPAWKSPWFWAALGGVAAVGVTVFVLAKTTGSNPGTVHLDGSVDP